MEAEIVALVVDIARQATDPAAAKAGPDQCADGGDQHAGDDEEFAEIVHGAIRDKLNR